MTKEHDDKGGSAFPTAWGNPEQGGDYVPGMSLRDWFAGQALISMGDRRWGGDHSETGTQKQARAAYRIADTMIAERAKGDAS